MSRKVVAVRRISRPSGKLVLAPDGVLGQAVPERPEGEPQELRGARLHPARLLQGRLEIAALQRVELALQRKPGRDAGSGGDWLGFTEAAEPTRKALRAELVGLRERGCTLDDVLQLADVSREVVATQHLERRGAEVE